MKRIFSGVQPSGNLTIGNYLGAIRPWTRMQDDGSCFFCIVDLHALTVPQDPNTLRHATREVAAAYIASGISPEKSSIFIQSAIPYHAELGWLLGCLTPLGWLNRMVQFKDKAGKNKDSAALGLYAYPVLQAADILLYKTTHVPVGEDQKQHLELARDIAGAFNRAYGVDFFPLPEPEIQGIAARVMSLRDGTKKMSKSDPSDFSRIHLTDTNDDIDLKIRKAKTDPLPLPQNVTDLKNRAEADNLVTIYASLRNTCKQTVLNEFGDKPFSVFKPALTACLIETVAPIRQEMTRLLTDTAALDVILKQGQENAMGIAEKTMVDLKSLMGIVRI